MFWLGLGIGVLIGAFVGVLGFCILALSKQCDDDIPPPPERERDDWIRAQLYDLKRRR